VPLKKSTAVYIKHKGNIVQSGKANAYSKVIPYSENWKHSRAVIKCFRRSFNRHRHS
jgi:hypothetical protein